MPLSPERACCREIHFHPGVGNNFCNIFIPIKHNVEEYQKEIARFTQPLNDADISLLLACKKILGSRKHLSLYNWAKVLDRKTNLLSIYHVEELVKYIEEEIIYSPIHDYLQKNYPEVLKKFLQIPEALFKINRINFYCSFEEAYLLFDKISDNFSKNLMFYKSINRVEIAKENLSNPDINKNYPKFIVVLDNRFLLDKEAAKIFLDYMKSTVASFKEQDVNDEFSWRLCDCITFTQGYKLYKRYLKLLGIIQKVYSQEYNYAFVKSDKKYWNEIFKEI